MYELRRTRTVQKRTLRCWSSPDTASKSRSATSSGASQSVPMSIIQSEYGQSARRLPVSASVPAREELLLGVVGLEPRRQVLALHPLEPGEEHRDAGAARDAHGREDDPLHAAEALAELARRDELDLGERAHEGDKPKGGTKALPHASALPLLPSGPGGFHASTSAGPHGPRLDEGEQRAES